MMLNHKLRIVGATSLIWIISLSSCSALKIKTWFADATQVSPPCQVEDLLVRKDSKGKVQEALTILQMDGYRCYSAADDEAWRNLLIACCNKSQQNNLNAPSYE